MRKIRFRGKQIDTGQWIYGDLVHWNRLGLCAILPQEGDEWHSPRDFEVIPETVGQFTGLQDTYGVDIYEGDLLKLRDPYNLCWTVDCGQVVFSNEYVGGWVLISNEKGALNIGSRTNHVKIM